MTVNRKKLVNNFYLFVQSVMPKGILLDLLSKGIKTWTIGDKITWDKGTTIVFSSKSIINIGNQVVLSNSSFNPTISANCRLIVASNAELTIGNNSGFSGVSLYCSKKITIGSNVICGGNVSIWDSDFHQICPDERRENLGVIHSKEIEIGDDVFIGANSMILKGVKIGNRSIVGAGSVVRKDIPNDEIWYGNPAQFIRKLHK